MKCYLINSQEFVWEDIIVCENLLGLWYVSRPQVLLCSHIWHQRNAILHCQGIRTEEGLCSLHKERA